MLYLQFGMRTFVLLLVLTVSLIATVSAQDRADKPTDKDAPTGQSAEESSDKRDAAKDVAKDLAKDLTGVISNPAGTSKQGEAANAVTTVSPALASQSSSAAPQAASEHDAGELSKKLANPLASLISFPVQTNFDFGMGTGNGWRFTMNVQPVIPVALSPKWNLISRTIIPIIHQGNVVAPGTGQSGLGDTVQSIFISPNKSEPLIWGVGPVALVPTATNGFLGSKQLALGPTVVVLKQTHGWTKGVLWNHLWRVAGGSGRPRVNADFVQPFLAYSTRDGWSYTINTEATYDWTGNHWSVPIHFQVAKIVRFGKQPISFAGALRCWATSPNGGPEGCGPRISITGIFPKK